MGEHKLSPKAAAEMLLKLADGWDLHEQKLRRRFIFKDFKEAQEFINKVAGAAEEAGHHPDITWNYNKVLLELTTHDAGGLSGKDFAVAEKIDAIK